MIPNFNNKTVTFVEYVQRNEPDPGQLFGQNVPVNCAL